MAYTLLNQEKIKNNSASKFGNLRTASLNLNFTGSYTKRVYFLLQDKTAFNLSWSFILYCAMLPYLRKSGFIVVLLTLKPFLFLRFLCTVLSIFTVFYQEVSRNLVCQKSYFSIQLIFMRKAFIRKWGLNGQHLKKS